MYHCYKYLEPVQVLVPTFHVCILPTIHVPVLTLFLVYTVAHPTDLFDLCPPQGKSYLTSQTNMF